MHHTALPSRRAARQAACFALLFSLVCHGYRFASMAFSGDSSLISQAGEAAYQISLGRFLQPVLWQIRGTINAPMTIGLFATAALMGAAVLVISLLQITDPLSIALVCGMLATNETLTVSYATYLPWVDVYMAALLFAMLGVYVGVRLRHGTLLSPLFYCISLALYQSYIQTAVALIIALLMLRLLDGEPAGAIWRDGIRSCLAVLAGLLLYAVALKAVLAALRLKPDIGYNTIGVVGKMKLQQVPSLLAETFRYPFTFFLRPAQEAVIPPLLTLALLVFAFAAALPAVRRIRLSAGLTLLLLLFLLPLGMNFAAFIALGTVHPLMVYSFFFLYLLAYAVCLRLPTAPALPDAPVRRIGVRLLAAIRPAAAAVMALMLAINVITANQLYLRRDLEFYSTVSAATRILERADGMEGYVPGETPVVLIGMLPSSSIGMVRPGFESTANLQGMRYTYAASYEDANPWYFQMILGYPVNLVSGAEAKTYSASGIADGMPCFPSALCCQMIDGKLFIRLN